MTPQYIGNDFVGLINTNRVTIPYKPSQQFTELTIELWVKPEESASVFKKDHPISLISKTHVNCVTAGYASACTMFCHFGILYAKHIMCYNN